MLHVTGRHSVSRRFAHCGCAFAVLTRGCARDAAPDAAGEDMLQPAAIEREVADAPSPAYSNPIGQWLQSTPVLAVRAGRGYVAVLQGPPAYISVYAPHVSEKLLHTHIAHTRFFDPREPGDRPRIFSASDVLGIGPTGAAWLLDAIGGRVVSEDVGGGREILLPLGARMTIRHGCMPGDTAVAVLDTTRVDTVFVHQLSAPAQVLAVPDLLASAEQAIWATTRFGGSLGGRCLLYRRDMAVIGLVRDSAVVAMPLLREQPQTLDVTSYPGYVAVLRRGLPGEVARRDPTSGRYTQAALPLVDFYQADGRYRSTLRLTHAASRIAVDDMWLMVLGERERQPVLSAFALPTWAAPTAPPAAPVLPPRPGAGFTLLESSAAAAERARP